ncbi:MAG: hypothetical protein N3E39_03155 [Candidatus Methanomethylicia archaeon]|nr:hypothetical protein [Candidatus Methanomethylicia archaeon]
MEFQWRRIIEKVLNIGIEDLIQLTLSTQDLCVIAEEDVYQSISMIPLISETLIGCTIRCHTPLEYCRYIAPYRDLDKIIILIDESEKITPQMKNLIDICRIMKFEVIAVLFKEMGLELKKIIMPKTIQLKIHDIKDDLEKSIVALTLMIKVISEAAIKRSSNPRAKDIIQELNNMEIMVNETEELKNILNTLTNERIKYIFSDHILFGILKVIMKKIVKNGEYKFELYRIDDHPKTTEKIKEVVDAIVFSSEVEEDLAKQICNYIKFKGGKTYEYIEKGEPILTPLKLSIKALKIIKSNKF